MTRDEKHQTIEALKEQFSQGNIFYLTDASTLTVAQVSKFRRICHEKGIKFHVAKNTMIKKAMEFSGEKYQGIYEALHGPTAIMFSESSSLPAKILKEFRKTSEKPTLKAAFIDNDVYMGDNQIEPLSALKSKHELLGDVLALLQSPARNVISALQSGGGKIGGILKTLSDRKEAESN